MSSIDRARSEWLQGFGFDYFATYTFKPKEDRVVGKYLQEQSDVPIDFQLC